MSPDKTEPVFDHPCIGIREACLTCLREDLRIAQWDANTARAEADARVAAALMDFRNALLSDEAIEAAWAVVPAADMRGAIEAAIKVASTGACRGEEVDELLATEVDVNPALRQELVPREEATDGR